MVSTYLKNISQIGFISPIFGMNINKYLSCHQLGTNIDTKEAWDHQLYDFRSCTKSRLNQLDRPFLFQNSQELKHIPVQKGLWCLNSTCFLGDFGPKSPLAVWNLGPKKPAKKDLLGWNLTPLEGLGTSNTSSCLFLLFVAVCLLLKIA